MGSTIIAPHFTAEPVPDDDMMQQDENHIPSFAWKERNLLSLDGGGIRGIWTLLALAQLMECIAQEELYPLEATERAEHSFHPLSFSKNVSHDPFETREDPNTFQTWKHTRRYLPCHYFDIICGSSTGALIAIMLGRLRMPVADCLHVYETLGNRIFGKPRFFTQISFGIIKRTKFKRSVLEDECRSIVSKRREISSNESGDATFPSDLGVCGTFVTTMKRTHDDTGLLSEAMLIRSYDNTKRGWSQELQGRTMEGSRHQTDRARTDTSLSGVKWVSTQLSAIRSPSGEAHKWPIWKVALAATAAPFYFGSFEADAQITGVQERVEYADGGLHGNNNPTTEGIAEIESLSSLGTVVSIGTSRGDAHSVMSIKKKLQHHFNEGSDPEQVHDAVNKKMRKRHKPYYRFNNSGALKMDLDEWKPRGLFTQNPGSQTLKTIRESFNEWIKLPENFQRFQSCAKELVNRRRERSKDEAKWEHFANGTRYWCQFKACNVAAFIDRDEFLKHFRRMHGTAAPNANEEEIIMKWSRSTQWRYREAPRA